MRDSTPRILVVAHDTHLASALVGWLADSGNELVFANSYAGGKAQLLSQPDVLITEVKLGEYNGLQLALRGQAAHIPTIVLGPDDLSFEQDAEELGAIYLSSDHLDAEDLAFVIEKALDANRLTPAIPAWTAPTSAHVLH